MGARTQEQVGRVVVSRQLGVGDVAAEVNVGDAEPRDEVMQRREIFVETSVGADKQQPGAWIEVALVGVEVADHVFDALVRNDPSDEKDVRPLVVELTRDEVVRLQIEVRKIGHDRQHAGGVEPQRFELLPVEFGIAEREIDAGRIHGQLAAALETLLRKLLVHIDEELRRRDVVVDENLSIGQRVCDARGPGADRKMMDQDVRRVAFLDEVAVVARAIFEPRVGGLNEDVGLEAGAAERPLDAEHFVADGIAIAERRENLMNLRLDQFNTGPDGSSASTSAAGRNVFRRRANQPGCES